ncbi:ABC transporter permease [Nonomuraea sp. NPDC050643]|uniref:ABC transporter permease n=1 Tax=Nonomuraea sp. NPDC050643 TaxID=3155660 RepID=UPI00340AA269
MSLPNTVAAEFRKIVTLPAAIVGVVLGTAMTLVFTAMAGSSRRAKLDAGMADDGSTYDLGLEMAAPGVVGVIVTAIVIISSEYTATSKDAGGGRQILVSLTGTPRRGELLAAKAVVVALVSGVAGAVTIGGGLLMTQVLLGRHGHPIGELMGVLGWRPVGAVAYWVLTALIAFAVAVMARSGIVPMVAFVVNTTFVSVTFLLTRVTSLAKYLPDVAGAQMFATGYPAESMVTPLTGAVVMTAWTVALLGVAAGLFVRRDA